jgi:hypothetical protein
LAAIIKQIIIDCCQVRVTIIEAKQLAGLDIDPVIKVDVGDQSRYTSIRKSNNSPYFNEYLVFDFRETAAMIFDKMITIAVSIAAIFGASTQTFYLENGLQITRNQSTKSAPSASKQKQIRGHTFQSDIWFWLWVS